MTRLDDNFIGGYATRTPGDYARMAEIRLEFLDDPEFITDAAPGEVERNIGIAQVWATLAVVAATTGDELLVPR